MGRLIQILFLFVPSHYRIGPHLLDQEKASSSGGMQVFGTRPVANAFAGLQLQQPNPGKEAWSSSCPLQRCSPPPLVSRDQTVERPAAYLHFLPTSGRWDHGHESAVRRSAETVVNRFFGPGPSMCAGPADETGTASEVPPLAAVKAGEHRSPHPLTLQLTSDGECTASAASCTSLPRAPHGDKLRPQLLRTFGSSHPRDGPTALHPVAALHGRVASVEPLTKRT
ncbi:uncharacterized protein THITE_2130234 [Thermothielavioides terrestris NRRL 8126]|uniref:Uncharacterized protein n=1 Tax=Thermothielavioides terrestris (strain ATCC 38088 / NRRL 8126) TaxID=578455 RepID=G2R6L4_THETT|nr:uncharacterized protein THITE_2130234 [Thermothielavioides terrestris NRRL 8126]AEO68495.1 hypothetical protein THITE_2130234 [Thermothielavioides terrestris NRRL 8126]